jgi:serine/threonine protein kinase
LTAGDKYALVFLREGVLPPLEDYKLLLDIRPTYLALFLGRMALRQNPSMCLIREHAPHGDARHFFEECEESDVDVSLHHRLIMGQQVAAGLAELHDASKRKVDVANHEMEFVHGDVSASNVLVVRFDKADPKATLVKLTGHCLVRETSKYMTATSPRGEEQPAATGGERAEPTRPMPMAPKWSAPESLKKGKFYHASDVWGLGVCLWEILTLCDSDPYLGVADTVMAMKMHLDAGNRLERPRECPETLYSILKRCWADKRTGRPSVADVRQALQAAAAVEAQ